MSRNNQIDRDEDEKHTEEAASVEGTEDMDEDMEALKRACMIVGADPSDFEDVDSESNAFKSVPGTGACDGGVAASNSESEDDLELFRNIRIRFCMSEDSLEPLALEPLCTLPPSNSSDVDEDDFKTLRAIQRRFSTYSCGGSPTNCEKDLLWETQQVRAYGIASEDGTSSHAIKSRTNAYEAFPESEKTCCSILDTEQTCTSLSHSEQAYNTSPNAEQACDFTSSIAACNIVPDSEGACNLVNAIRENVSTQPTVSFKYSSFPESAQVFIDAIKRNRSYQRFLRSKLVHVEARIEENKKLKDRVKILKDFQASCKKSTGRALSQKKDHRVQLISAQKTGVSDHTEVDDKKPAAMRCGPMENSHVHSYRMALTNYPLSLYRKKWSTTEKENLAKGIRQQFQERLLQLSVDRYSGLDVSEDAGNLDRILVSIKELEVTPEHIRQFLPKINWDKLASMYVVGRPGTECEAQWLNWEDPLVNHNPWTPTEDKNLLFALEEKGITNWLAIAVSLGTNRTPFQCLERYQRSLNTCILKSEWTKDEDDQLRMAVGDFGEHDWQSVASVLKGRTGTQCSNRWTKSLHPSRLRSGRWTPDEDKRLKVAVMLFGPKSWIKVAQFVPGRTQVQCRERWFNCLDPSLDRGKWTEEEDSVLKAAIAEHGYSWTGGFCWSKIAAHLPSRTDNQCWRRWKTLFPHEVKILQQTRRTRKAAFISNFVDRESERPALEPNDYLPLPALTFLREPETVDPSRKRKIRFRKQESENGRARDAGSGNAPEKVRSKRPRKRAKSSSQEIIGKNISEDVTIDGNDSKKKAKAMCLENSVNDLTGAKRKKRVSKNRAEKGKISLANENNQGLPLLPIESLESGISDCAEMLGGKDATSSVLRSAPKKHVRKRISVVSGEKENLSTSHQSILPGPTNVSAVSPDQPSSQDSTMPAIANCEEAIGSRGVGVSLEDEGTSCGDDVIHSSVHLKSKKKHQISKSRPESLSSKRSRSKRNPMLSGGEKKLPKGKEMVSTMQSPVACTDEIGRADAVEHEVIGPTESVRETGNVYVDSDYDDETLAAFVNRISKKRRIVVSNNISATTAVDQISGTVKPGGESISINLEGPYTISNVTSNKDISRKDSVKIGAVATKETVHIHKEGDSEPTLAHVLKRLKRENSNTASYKHDDGDRPT